MPSAAALQAQRGGLGQGSHLPAPYNGLNTRDPQFVLKPLDSIQLINFYPESGQLTLRGGSTLWMTVNPASIIVKALAPWVGPTTQKLFAVTDSGFVEITAGSGTSAVVAQPLTNGDFRWINLTNSAGNAFLWGVNGTDNAKMYDGTTWSTPAVTGLGIGTSSINNCFLFKRKIWMVQKNSMNLWYLPTDSVQGAAVNFPVGALFKRGGYVVSGFNWSRDGGDGLDDYLIIISSEGEVAVYQGTDPSSTTSWGLVGVFFVGKPVGPRPFEKLGGEVGIITESGFYPLSAALVQNQVDYQKAFSDKIRPTFGAEAKNHGTLFGWQTAVVPFRNALVINVPQAAYTTSYQYVLNTVTGAWTQFRGWDAQCMLVWNGDLYIGRIDGTIWKVWQNNVAFSDAGADITAVCQTSFNYFPTQGALSQVGLFRPLIFTDGDIELAWGLMDDFRVATYSGRQARPAAGSSGTTWDVTAWDAGDWSTYGLRKDLWKAASCRPGYGISLLLQLITKNANVAWAGTDYVLQRGGLLG